MENFNALLTLNEIKTLYSGKPVGICPLYKGVLSVTKTFEATGNPITIPEYKSLVKLATKFSPKQAGTGNPSPENVRPISGWDEVAVTRCGKNLLNPENIAAYGAPYGMTVTYENENIFHIVGKPNNPENGELAFTIAELLDYSLSGKDLVITPFKLSGNLTVVRAYGLRTPTERLIALVAYLDNTVTYDARIQLAVSVENLTTYEPYQGDTYEISLPETVYGGTVDAVTGAGSKTWGFIASYNGEALPGEWISNRDVYVPGTTPTTGAQVAYKLATPEPFKISQVSIPSLGGENYFFTNGENMDIIYKESSFWG